MTGAFQRRAAVVLAGACCAALSASAAAAGVSPGGWDARQQRQVLAAGLMENVGRSFDGAGRLSRTAADAAMAALASRLAPSPPAAGGAGSGAEAGQPAAAGQTVNGATAAGQADTPPAVPASTGEDPVTMVGLDRLLVDELGLRSVAEHVEAVAAGAGLRPPRYFGTEVVARLLELRYEHPVGSQRLDLFPTDPVTRAEAAWSLAQVLAMGEWELASARQELEGFELPRMSAAQRQALGIAVAHIGYPYVWGGTTDDTADGLEHGGFDCSGFAWRVFKLSGLPWGRRIGGRTAAEQAGEIPRSRRLRIPQLKPGDLLFFGSARFNGRATEQSIVHEGIYLGENWVIHSSGQGVYVLPLRGSWLGSQFAWGRRVIG